MSKPSSNFSSIDGFSTYTAKKKPRPPKPCKFTTANESLARAVGNELIRLGVSDTLLHAVDTSSGTARDLAALRFREAFQTKAHQEACEAGVFNVGSPAAYTPPVVQFGQRRPQNFDFEDGSEAESEEDGPEWLHQYERLMYAANPSDGRPKRGPQACDHYIAWC